MSEHEANPKALTLWERLRSFFSVANSTFVHDIHNTEFEYEYYYVEHYADYGSDSHYMYYTYYYYHVENDAITTAGYGAQLYDYGAYYVDYHGSQLFAVAEPDNQMAMVQLPSLSEFIKMLSIATSVLARVWPSDDSNMVRSTAKCLVAMKYGYYGSALPQQAPMQDQSSNLWPVAATIGATVPPIMYKQRRRLVGLLGLARQAQRACCMDAAQVLLAVLMCVCNVLLVMVKRIPAGLGKKILRKVVLRARNACERQLGETVVDSDNDVVYIEPRQASAAFSTSNYHVPLNFIQREGGKALRATWAGKRRWRAPRMRAMTVMYNPSVPGDCLFDAAKFIIAKAGKGHCSSSALRKLVKGELLRTIQNGDLIHGQPIEHWARQINMSVVQLISTTTGRSKRWGNTLDMVLIARLFDIGVKVIDRQSGRVLAEHRANNGKMWIIGHGACHFTVLRVGRAQLSKLTSPTRSLQQNVAGGGNIPMPDVLTHATHNETLPPSCPLTSRESESEKLAPILWHVVRERIMVYAFPSLLTSDAAEPRHRDLIGTMITGGARGKRPHTEQEER
eukprot:1137146-Amphidinium_carterae.1